MKRSSRKENIVQYRPVASTASNNDRRKVSEMALCRLMYHVSYAPDELC